MTAAHGSPTEEPLAKQRLHQLIDALPEDEIQAAERCLESLCNHRDPVLDAIRSAPDVEEPFSEEEEQGVDDAIRDLRGNSRQPRPPRANPAQARAMIWRLIWTRAAE